MSLIVKGIHKTIEGIESSNDISASEIKIYTAAGVLIMTITATGAIQLASGATLDINSQTVVKGRLTAVTAPTGGATIDAECRTAVAAVIDRLKASTGHGLIT